VSNELVFEKKGYVYTNSRIISDKSEIQHESVARMISNNIEDFKEFGSIDFTDLKSGKRGRPTRIYNLNQHQSTLLLTYLDNTDPVKKFKKNLVRAFFQMEQHIKDIYEAKADFPEFTDAILSMHSEPKPFHFTNEIDMINRIVTGMPAKQIKETRGIDKSVASIRPYLRPLELSAIKALQRVDIGMIIAVPDFQDRKQKLTEYYNNRIKVRQLSA
jgi:phage regulator Rha-like protein